MHKKSVMSALILSAFFSSAVLANTACPQFYASGKEPTFTVPMTIDQELCYTSFAVGYHYRSRTALYSAQRLTRAAVTAAKALDRVDSFHEEDALPDAAQAKLAWYRGSGLTRGHLTANKDVGDRQSQYDSFSLANIVPQDAKMNSGIWLDIEQATRAMALKEGEIYVVTGGVYDQTTQNLRGQMPVPSALFKAVYIPSKQLAGVYFSENNRSGNYQIMSVVELAKKTGFDVFPSISPSLKQQNELLAPVAHKVRNKRQNWFFN